MNKNTEDIINKLNVIASIKKDQTFSDAYDIPLDHNIWSTTLWRTYNREDRKKSINSINTILDQAYTLYTESYDSNIMNMIMAALSGLENLKITYKGDHMIIGLIDTIIDNYNKKYQISIDQEPIFFTHLRNANYGYIEDYLYNGNNPNIKNNDLQNALHIVCDKKYYYGKIMDILVNFNIALTDKDKDDKTPLYYAVTSGCTEAVLKLEECIAKKRKEINNH
jgi:ankyrin repeat protein